MLAFSSTPHELFETVLTPVTDHQRLHLLLSRSHLLPVVGVVVNHMKWALPFYRWVTTIAPYKPTIIWPREYA
jgi:hypothetical protein